MGNAAKNLPPLMTYDEFVAWGGDGTDTRYELVDGIVRAQDAASDGHGTIQANIAGALHAHLRGIGSRCRVVTAGGVRPKLRADWNFRIPDVLVTCAPSLSGAKDVPDPVVLIEVLSPSNAAETWDNVRNFVTIPTVREILLVSSARPEVLLLARDASGVWPDNPVTFGPRATVPISAIEYALPLPDIYWNTYLEARANGSA